MSQKRIRSINWDEEEKQLLRSVLKEYASIIENKSLDNNTNKKKNKAWEEVHKKFNELNVRPRQLGHLKIQWKTMKINARKTYNTFKKETNKTGGGARPTTPNDMVIEVKDLLNPAELLRDHNIYDSDGIDSKPMTDIVIALDTYENDNIILDNQYIAGTLLKDNVAISLETSENDIMQENQDIAEHNIRTIEDVNKQADVQKFMAEPVIVQDNIMVTPIRKYVDPMSAKSKQRRKIQQNKVTAEPGSKSRKDTDYVYSMMSHSKMLKDEEHMRRMEMADEEHAIKMAIHQEKLKSAILEREILQLRKLREEKNVHSTD